MRSALAMTAGLLLACATEEFPPGAPPGIGNPGIPSRGGADAGGGGADGGGPAAEISGLLCVAADVRTPFDCGVSSAVAGLEVRLVETGDLATSDAGGRFRLPAQAGVARVHLQVSDATQLMAAGGQTVALGGDGAAEVLLPLVTSAQLDELEVANLVGGAADRGHVVVLVSSAGSPVSDAVLGPMAGVAPAYDQGDPLFFVEGGLSGGFGFAAYFDVPAGVELDFTVTAGGPSSDHTAFAVARGVVFTEVELAP
jgi:hypothetical protein